MFKTWGLNKTYPNPELYISLSFFCLAFYSGQEMVAKTPTLKKKELKYRTECL